LVFEKSDMKIFIVIPFHNEKKHIVEVLKSLGKYKLPVVVVDDGSKDGSGSGIEKAKFKNVTLINHKINLGKGAAMKTGAEYSFSHGAEAIIFMDGDGQHKASDIPQFKESLEGGKVAAVFGTRNYKYGIPLLRFLGNKFASFMLAVLFKIYISDVLCGFKGITKGAYKKIKWESVGYGVETEMVARIGKEKLSFSEVPIEAIYHDKVKGVTILDGLGIIAEIIKWRFTI